MKNKSKEMQKVCDIAAKNLFGRSIHDNACPCCGNKNIAHDDFRDELSWKEFNISRLCQECQDKIWG